MFAGASRSSLMFRATHQFSTDFKSRCTVFGDFTTAEEIELEKVLQFADRIILRPTRLWTESTLEQRQRLQKTLFPNGIEFDGEQFGTDVSPLLFRLLDGISEDDFCLASPAGFEPALPP